MATSLAFALFEVLKLFHQITGNYIVDIILLTLTIKLTLHPSTRNQMLFSRKMQKLQPEMKRLEELKKKKDGKQEYNKAVMELYKREGLNPASGCLPMFIQLPIMFGLFLLLQTPEVNGGIMEQTKLFGIPLSQVPYTTLTQLPLPDRYEDTDVTPDKDFTYRIVVLKGGKDGGVSDVATGRRVASSTEQIPPPPQPIQPPYGYEALHRPRDLHASDGSFPDLIEVKFKQAQKATANTVSRSEAESGPFTALTGKRFSGCGHYTCYKDENIEHGKTYWYWLEAQYPKDPAQTSNVDSGYSGLPLPTEVNASTSYGGGILVTWKHAAGAEAYRVERADSAKGPFTTVAALSPTIPPNTIRFSSKQGKYPATMLIFWPGFIFIALYALLTWKYQKQFSKLSGMATAPRNPAMPNMNLISMLFVAFSIIFPLGLILYFISFNSLGIIEGEIIMRWLHGKFGPPPAPKGKK
ncbi:MAG: membrane protein insertase YidC [bacterium]